MGASKPSIVSLYPERLLCSRIHCSVFALLPFSKAIGLTKGNSEIEDCTQDWTFRSEDFDYVHIRWLVGSIQDWDALMRQAYRVLRPGGYIESLETSAIMTSDDGSVTETCAMGQWGKFFINGGKKIGRTFTVYEDETQRKSIEAAGFVDIQEFNFKVRQRSVAT